MAWLVAAHAHSGALCSAVLKSWDLAVTGSMACFAHRQVSGELGDHGGAVIDGDEAAVRGEQLLARVPRTR